MPPNPPPDANTVQDVKPDTRERVLGGLGALVGGGDFKGSGLDQKIQEHHQRRLHEAQMHRHNAGTYVGILATGTDPNTGQPLSDADKAKYQAWFDASWAAYEKAAGVSKETKGAIQKQKAILGHVVQAVGGGGQQKPQAGAQAQAPIPAQGAAPQSADQPRETPKLPPPPPYDAQAQASAPALASAAADQRDFAQWKRGQDLLHQYKMEEQEALQKAKSQSGPTARPVWGPALSVRNARDMARQGKQFLDENGEPVDLTTLPDNMGLKAVTMRGEHGWETRYVPFSPNSKVITAGNESYAINPMDVEQLPKGEGTDLGEKVTSKSGTHEAPMIGPDGKPIAVPLHSTSAPSTPGVKGRGAMTPPPPASGAAPSEAPKGQKSPPKGKVGAPSARELPGIPAGVYNQQQQRVTPVREAATQLYGSPDQPNFHGLMDYASVADDQASNERIGKAWLQIRKHMDAARGGSESGDLLTMLKNYMGVPGALAESEVSALRDTLTELEKHPKEEELFNRLFNAYGTIIGLRSLTRGSAAKFSAKNMEQEVPIPGVNVRSKAAFLNKLEGPATQINNGFYGVPDQMFKPGEREYYKKQGDRLSGSGGKGSGRLPSPPASSDSSKPMSADEFKRKHGIH